MSKTTLFSFTLAACLALGACADDESRDPPSDNPALGDPSDVPGPTVIPDGSVAPPAIAPAVDGDTGTPPVAKAIPLIDWVDDLLDHHTTDEATPDTVHDKNIADNEDPTTFAKRF